jgi:hypothetical protein
MDFKNYQDDEFEQLLQDELKQHRMYPSDHVWGNIRTEIHGNQTWHALTFIALLIISGLTVSTLLLSPSTERFKVTPPITSILIKKISSSVSTVATKENNEPYFGVIEPQNITQQTLSNIESNQLLESELANNPLNGIPELTVGIAKIPENLSKEKTSLPNSINFENTKAIAFQTNNSQTISVNEEIEKINEEVNLLKVIPTNKKAILEDEYLKKIVPNTISIPWKKVSKIGFQFYVTPSKSYRTLSDADVKEVIQPSTVPNASNQNIPLGLNYSATVNDIVRHSPSLGLEIGLAALYNISNRLKFKTGVQVNVRQYHIETFKTAARDVSTLSLINNGGIQTINLFSTYNNNAGYKSEQLNNQTYQVSIPVGIQWEVLKGKRLGLNAEASVQPTYSINNSTFLLSTDYKNYTDGNGLLRKWNINTSVGVNFSYKSGANLWQIGPQVRFQHLPSYNDQYPIKEHLLDYGIRLGITRQWK